MIISNNVTNDALLNISARDKYDISRIPFYLVYLNNIFVAIEPLYDEKTNVKKMYEEKFSILHNFYSHKKINFNFHKLFNILTNYTQKNILGE